MNRTLAFVGAFAFALALAAAQPAVTLGAPPRGLAPSRPAAVAPHVAARGGSVNRDDFKVPFHVDVQPKPLTEPQALVPPYRQHGWQPPLPGYLWYPALYGPACYASNNFSGSPSKQQPSDLTIGSLVDGKSKLLSPLTYNAGLAAGNDPDAASLSPVKFQVGFYPTACGTPSFTNL